MRMSVGHLKRVLKEALDAPERSFDDDDLDAFIDQYGWARADYVDLGREGTVYRNAVRMTGSHSFARAIINRVKQRLSEGRRLVEDASEQEKNTSIDAQVDRYLAEYESEAKHSKNEGLDLRSITRNFLLEAEGDEDAENDNEDDAQSAQEKPGLDAIDVESFANSVVRLIDNYDSLLEVKSTLARRAMNFIAKSYSRDVLDALKKTLREDHGIVPGESKQDIDAEEFKAPPADRAGEGGAGAPG